MKTIIVTLGFLFVASLGFAQTQLSNDFNNATEMYVNTECIFETYRYNHDFGSDLPDLKCDRMYPGVSSYFIFKITENSSLTLKIQFETEKFFGLAFYTLQNGDM